MPPKFGSKVERKCVGELRRSQIMTTFGCGAIADFPRLSGIMMGLDEWNISLLKEEDSIIHERNLEQYLGKRYFVQPSTPENETSMSEVNKFIYATNKDKKETFGLPVERFPNFYYCPECHMLDYHWKIGKVITNQQNKNNSILTCNNCGPKTRLIPSRFIVACLNGHIDDFPYVWWVHKETGFCESPRLKLEYKGTTGGLDSIHIYCESCPAKTTMKGCMREESLRGLKCKGKMPWLEKGYTEPEECNAQPRALQRSANNVYYPVKHSALTIPPWSNAIQEVLNKYHSQLEFIFEGEDNDKLRLLKRLIETRDIQKQCGFSENIIIQEAFKRFEETDKEITDQSLVINEYKALCLPDVDERYFKTTNEPVPGCFQNLIEQVKLVKRLREVQVLQGFRRIFPEYQSSEQIRREQGIYEREFTPISKQPLDWLPAVELFGEGIFIKLAEDALVDWGRRNFHRYADMARRIDKSWIGKEMFSPRYVLLHTLSHMLIRQLSFQCGYSSASLKEKIYSTYPGIDEPMSGILIYTAATDSDGSLGGLVRQGSQKHMENTIKAALQESTWCSNDPVCIDSKAQGYKSLNYAACHACVLLPETSCESINCLLDRATITGTPEDKGIGFFQQFI